ncbi:MAG: glycosyltransferase family 2 protein [Solirubrobacteraceae bacterium]|nr:glycosyltransferase family 2 protein [Solirubrobacteraceae bacterium]
MRRLRQSAWVQLFGIHAICIGSPLLIILGAGPYSDDLRAGLQMVVATAFVVTSILIIAEALMSGRRRRGPAMHGAGGPVRSLTVILVAYLPNEQEVILESTRALVEDLQHPADRLQVVVAYNTPVDLPIENDLHELAARHPNLDVVRVEGSTSKAENLEVAIDHARGQVTAILDSDHRLQPDAAARALRWFDEGYDVVQGRCVIRDSDRSLLTRIVAIEFEQIYGLAHAGRSLLMDTAIFGGANGWWRTDVIREIRFDKGMLTEDIDASTRSLLAGYRLVHDRTVISTELAPSGWRGWVRQRTRWAQGWLQVTMRHQRSIWRSEQMSWTLKGYWTVLLAWREIFPVLSLQIVTLILSDLFLNGRMELQFDPLVAVSVLLTFTSGTVAALVTYRLSMPTTRQVQGAGRYVIFGILSPVYTQMRNFVALLALGREMLGDERWVVTARRSATVAAAALTATLTIGAAGPLTPNARAQDVPVIPAVPEAPQPETSSEPTAIEQGTPTISGVRTVELVPPGASPVSVTAGDPRTAWSVRVPGWWTAARGRLTLNLAGNRQLAASSRVAVSIGGRQVAAGRAWPGERTISVDLPATDLAGNHVLPIEISATLATTLGQCAAPDDPTATLQVLPGSKLELEGAVNEDLAIRDLPAALVGTVGDGPAPVLLRFAGGAPTPAGIAAAGIAAGAISQARGYPGVRVRIAGEKERATLMIDDRPGAPRLRISTRSGIPTLTIGGTGQQLIDAARAIGDPSTRSEHGSSITPGKLAATPARLPLPATIELGGASDEGPGRSAATVFFQLPGRYEVQRGAQLRVVANIDAAGQTRTSFKVNDRKIDTRLGRANGQPVSVDTLLAGSGPSYLRGDLVPGTNRITVEAESTGTKPRCGALGTVRTEVQPTGTLQVRVSERSPRNASLSAWPYPLDTKPNARTSDVILPKTPSLTEAAAVVSVLAEVRRIDGEVPLPTVRFGGDPDPKRPALVLARSGSVPTSLGSKVKGGTPTGTLAIADVGGGVAQVLAVGAVALRPLTAGVQPSALSALVTDVTRNGVTTRVADTRAAASATTPLPGRVKWPLLVLGCSLAGIAVLSLRASAKKREKQLQR